MRLGSSRIDYIVPAAKKESNTGQLQTSSPVRKYKKWQEGGGVSEEIGTRNGSRNVIGELNRNAPPSWKMGTHKRRRRICHDM